MSKKHKNESAGTEPAKTTVPAAVSKVNDIRHTFDGINVITKRHLSEAEKLFEKIGTGKENAIKVSGKNAYDKTVRAFKLLVAEARKQGDPIVNLGKGEGYYRVNWDRPNEVAELEAMIKSLAHRSNEIDEVKRGLEIAKLLKLMRG